MLTSDFGESETSASFFGLCLHLVDQKGITPTELESDLYPWFLYPN